MSEESVYSYAHHFCTAGCQFVSAVKKRDLVFAALPSVVVITEIIYKPVSKHFAELSVVLIITHNNI